MFFFCFFFFFKQKTAYEIVPCDWSSDVCSSDLRRRRIDGSRNPEWRSLRLGTPDSPSPPPLASSPSGPPLGVAPTGCRRRNYQLRGRALTSLPMHEWQVWFVAALLLCVAEMIAPGFWLL